MKKMKRPPHSVPLPAIYIQAKNDKLIRDNKWIEFKQVFPAIKRYSISDSHFILQARPKQCAELIEKIVLRLSH